MSFNLKILGSSSATPAHGRFPTAQLLQIEQYHFLIDCGEGTQFQLLKYHCKLSRISHILISHLHGDHFYGLIGLLSTMNLNGRTASLELYGPPGLLEIITTQFRCSDTRLEYGINFHPLEPRTGIILEDDHLTLSTLPLHHGIACTGFLFREKPRKRRINPDALPGGVAAHQIKRLKEGKDIHDQHGNLLYANAQLTLPPRPPLSYAYCSDTAYHEPVIAQVAGADLLYHEATFLESEAARAAHTLHSTARQAATVAQLAGVKQLLIGHFSARYKDLAPLLAEARGVFANTQLAVEGLTVSLLG